MSDTNAAPPPRNDPPPHNGNGWTRPVTRAVTALQGTPMLLVLTLLNAAMFAMLTWLIMQSAEYRFKERTELMVIIKTCLDELQRDRGGAQFSSPKMSVPLRKPQSGQVSK